MAVKYLNTSLFKSAMASANFTSNPAPEHAESTKHNPHGYLRLIGGRIVCDGHELLGVHTTLEVPLLALHGGVLSLLFKAREKGR